MTIEIVDFYHELHADIFHRYVTVYQRVNLFDDVCHGKRPFAARDDVFVDHKSTMVYHGTMSSC